MNDFTPIRRTVFFVDGFNLYHSVQDAAKDAAREIDPASVPPFVGHKWLDLPTLFRAHLHNIGNGAILHGIEYFTAYPEHLNNPDKLARHKAFVRALSASRPVRVGIHEGRFNQRDAHCGHCDRPAPDYQEKETDVAIACSLLKRAARNELDVAVIVSGDSDQSPAVRTFRELYPEKQILFAFPYKRETRALKRLAPESFSFSKESYAKHQFPEQVKLPSGNFVTKPAGW